MIRMPEYTANFCFGDDDLRSLYVTASSSLYPVSGQDARHSTAAGVLTVVPVANGSKRTVVLC